MLAVRLDKMDADLVTLLESQGVSEEIRAYLVTIKCVSLALFTSWAKTIAETDKYLSKSRWADDDAENARLTGAWKRASADETRTNKRRAEGIDDEALDEPLRKEVQEAMMLKFLTTYDIRDVRPSNIGSDLVVARFKREFEAYLVQPFEFMKMKSQGEGRASSRKTTKIADRIEMSVLGGEPDAENESGPCLWAYTERFRMAVTTWAVAGCYDVEWKAPGAAAATQVRYCHLSDATDYMYEFLEQIAELRLIYFEGSIYLYLDDAERRIREKAIALNRGRHKYPWGPALLQALRNTPNAWQLAEKLLKERPPKGKGRGREQRGIVDWPLPPPQPTGRHGPYSLPPPPPRVQNFKGKHESKGTGKANAGRGGIHNFYTASENERGPICKAWNDQRGCSNAQCTKSHVCDVLLESGTVCGKRNHKRMEHSDAKDGVGRRR